MHRLVVEKLHLAIQLLIRASNYRKKVDVQYHIRKGGITMIYNIGLTLVGVGVFLLGLGILIHICSKNKYSFKYESTKRKFEIYPNNRNKSQIP